MEIPPERLVNPFGRKPLKVDLKLITIAQKQWLINEIIHYKVPAVELTKRYQFSPTYLGKMVQRYQIKPILKLGAGRTPYFDEDDQRKIKLEVNAGIHNKSTAEFSDILNNHRVIKNEKVANIAKCSTPQISRRCESNYRGRMGLKRGNGEQSTDARDIATANKFNFVSTAAAHSLVMPLTVPYLVINSDGTSFQTGGSLTDKVAIVYDPEEQKRKGIH